MPNTTNKRIQQYKGFYRSLKDVKCDCGQPATKQVQVQLINANDREIKQVMPLCDGCYELMCQEDTGILQAA
jgi:hypothetical protein